MSDPLIPLEATSSAEGRVLLAATRHSTRIRETGLHRHARGQLLASASGLLSVQARDMRWVVPALHAVWIPPHIEHGVRSHGPFSGWSLYLAESACGALPDQPRVLETSGLLREAVARAATWTGVALDDVQCRLAAVIVDEIRALRPVALSLPLPRDARLRRIAQALSDRPDDGRGLNDWATWAGVSPRTLTRRFRQETGFTFTQWRQRVRLLRALEWLGEGRPVTTVALDLGYANVSAFIALFRRVFGATPGRHDGVTRLSPH